MAPSPEWPLEERLAGTRLRRLSEPERERPAPAEPAAAYEGCALALQAPDAGACRRQRSPTWGTASLSAGCACVVVVRPVRATPARMPTTLCGRR